MAFCSPNGDEQSLCTGRKYEGNGGGYISEDESAQSEADSEPGEPENGWESGESSPELDEEQPKRRRTGSVSNYANRTPEVSEKISLKKSFYGSAPTKPVKHSTPRSSVPKTTLATSVGRTPTCQKSLSTHPKVLNMGIGSAPGDQSSSLSSVLGNITNMLGSVIERLDKTESKLESMERKLNSPSSSSAGSGAERKRSVPPVVRTETRKVYKTLLDGDDFTGFDLSPDTTYKDDVNQTVSTMLVKEVRVLNPSFVAADVRAAAYTYYTSLCQDETQKRKGLYAQRKIQRRRRERVVRRRAERESQFNKMSYNDSDRAKWKKVLITEFMSSDESGTEDGEPVFIVKTLPWRSERVSKFFQRLDAARDARKSEQANRQTKPRVYKDLVSSRPLPTTCAVPTWAVVL